MKSAIKKLRRSGAFSLLEALIAVALIGILSAVSFIAVIRYQRNMQLLKMDATAKEMFIAAQNHLSMAEGQGFLGITEFGEEENAGAVPEIRYLLINGNTVTPGYTSSVLSLMLPVGSIEDSVRTGGNYIIRYQKEPARILDVFYAENSGRFAHEPAFDTTEYNDLWINRDSADYRKNYNYNAGNVKGAVIGYYGGAVAIKTPAGSIVELPSLSVENGDILRAVVTWERNFADETLRLVIKGLLSGAEKALEIDISSGAPDGVARSYSVVLDDISKANFHFKDIMTNPANPATPFLPGEDIELYATAQSTHSFSNVANSAKLSVNSLFASVSGTGSDKSAAISSIRHLENLDPNISSLDSGLGISKAVQQNNLYWDSYKEAVKGAGSPDEVQICDKSNYATGKTTPGCYMPISPDYLRSYDGNDFKIDGIKVDAYGDAGLFANLEPASGIEIKNLELVNFHIKSILGNAGTLAGSLTNASLSEILARNDKGDSVLEIYAKNSAGGLVGVMEDSGALCCAASVYVKSDSGAAGGLIGSIENSGAITGCYSGGHTKDGEYKDDITGEGRINVIGRTAAGGFIGDASVSSGLAVTYSYSTCSVRGATPGGFIGRAGGAEIGNCYSTGRVNITGASPGVKAFAGNAGTATFTNNEYLSGMSDSETEDPAVASPKSAEQLAPASKGAAVPYDPKVMADNITSGGVAYAFRTVANMIPGVGADSFVSRHYGDWGLMKASALHTAYFFFRVPELDGGGNKTGNYIITPVPGPALGTQYTQYLADNTTNIVTPPYPKAEYEQYALKFTGWYTSEDPDNPASFTELAKDPDWGWISLSEAQSVKDINIYGVYDTGAPSGYYYRARFYSYEPESGARPLISDQVVFGEGKSKTLFAPYAPILDDHVFIGWFDAETGGNPVATNNSVTFNPSSDPHLIEAYARYEKVEYGNVSVGFALRDKKEANKVVNLPIEPYLLKLPKGEYNTLYNLPLPTKADLFDFNNYIKFPNPNQTGNNNLFKDITCAEGSYLPSQFTGVNNDIILRDNASYIPEMDQRSFKVHYEGKSNKTYTLKESFRDTLNDTLAYSAGEIYSKQETRPCIPDYFTDASPNPPVGFYTEPFANKIALNNGKTVVEIFYTRKRNSIIYSGMKGDPWPSDIVAYGRPLSEFSSKIPSAEETPDYYEFIGWEVTDMEGNPYAGSTMPDFPLIFKAKWRGQAPYTVVYWKENPDDDGYAVDVETTDGMCPAGGYKGKIGEETDVNFHAVESSSYASEYEGFELNTAKTQQEIIEADGSTIVNIYYKRKIYTIKFMVPSDSGDSFQYLGDGVSNHFYETGALKQLPKDTEFTGTRIRTFYTLDRWSWIGADFYRRANEYFQYQSKNATPTPYFTYTYPDWFSYNKLPGDPPGYTTDIKNRYYYAIEYKSSFGYAQFYSDGLGNFYKMDRQDTDGNYIYYRHVDFSLALEAELRAKGPGYFEETPSFVVYDPFTIEAKYGQDIHMLWPSKRDFDPSVTRAKNSRWSFAEVPSGQEGSPPWQIKATTMPLGGATYYWVDEGGYHTVQQEVYLQDFDGNYVPDAGYSPSYARSGYTPVPRTFMGDYTPVNGFSIRIRDTINHRNIFSGYSSDQVRFAEKAEGNLSYDFGTQYGRTGISWPRTYTASFYYERNSYTVSAYNDSNAAAAYDTLSYKFETTLYKTDAGGNVTDNTLLNALASPTPPGEGYIFEGWYGNKYYAGEKLFPTTANYEMKMRAGNLNLYAKWTPPLSGLAQKTVTFNLSSPAGASGMPVMTGNLNLSIDPGLALDTMPEVANGSSWTAAYTPYLSNYIFDGWFTSESGGTRFLPTEPISENIQLYAHWKDASKTLTIKHVLWTKEAYGEEIPDPSDIRPGDIFDMELRENFPIEIPQMISTDIKYGADGFACKPIVAEQQVYIAPEETNPTIYFFYTKSTRQEINCQLEYYIVCNPLDPGLKITVGPISGGNVPLHYDYEPIYFSLPEGYENYHQVDENGSTQSLLPYVISNAKEPVVKFYMAPNFDSLRLPNAYCIYDGTDRVSAAELYIAKADAANPREEDHLVKWTAATFKLPANGGEFELLHHVVYPATATTATNVGEYLVQAELYFHKGTQTICVWRSSETTLRVASLLI